MAMSPTENETKPTEMDASSPVKPPRYTEL